MVGVGALIPTNAAASGSPTDLVATGENEFDIDGDGNADVKVYNTPDPEPNSENPEDPRGSRGLVTLLTSDGVRTTDYATSIVDIDDRQFSSFTHVTFDFYAGVDNENAAPDEFWMLVEEEDGTEHVLFDTYNLETNDPNWQGVNVTKEKGHLQHPEWKELVDATTIGRYVVSPSDTVKRMGVGRGSTQTARQSEVYYDNLRIDGERVGEFPAEGYKGRGR